ncbi:MAG: glycosyltransferase family 4 protein [Vulcanimicrobiota bacterium]
MKAEILFCLTRTVMGDCTRLLFGLADRLLASGRRVEVASWGSRPDWYSLQAPFVQSDDLPGLIQARQPEVVVVSNAHLVPSVGRFSPKLIFFCQGYESFYYGQTLEELRRPCPVFGAIEALPLNLVAVSRSVQGLLGQPSHYVPVGIEKLAYRSRPTGPLRILMSGAPLAPYKGMSDGFAALDELARRFDFELVLLSPETSPRDHLEGHQFGWQVLYKPDPDQLEEAFASCHAYLCSSWYEGHDLATLQAMASGLPVVSTRNLGVDDYGRAGQNMLLVEAGDRAAMARALEQVLTEEGLGERLSRQARRDLEGRFEWPATLRAFEQVLADARPWQPDQAELERLAKELVEQGVFTPIETYRVCEQAREVIAQCRSGGVLGQPERRQLEDVRHRLAALLECPTAEFYGAARASFDLAGVLLTWSQEPSLWN